MFSRTTTRFACIILIVAFATGRPLPADAATRSSDASHIGKQIDDFRLTSSYGQKVSLNDYADSELVAVVFLGTGCQLSKNYVIPLLKIQEEFPNEKLQILGIDSNRQDSLKDIKKLVIQESITFPMLKDLDGSIAKAFGAKRNPEVFLLDQERKVRYYGRIDDQHSVGISKKAAEATYLVDAINQLLSSEPVNAPMTEADGCLIGFPPDVPPTGEITFTKHIAPILNAHCVSCHREGEIAPFTMGSYEEVAGWEDMILEVLDQKRMPPWSASPKHGTFSNAPKIKPEEIEKIEEWVLNGIPQGDPADLPAAPTFTEGWQMDEPDFMVHMRESQEPYEVPSEGVVEYQHWVVNPNWKEDKYIVQAEARPGNRAVVHHIIVYVIPPEDWDDEKNEIKENRTRFSMLAGYAPGLPPTKLGDGVAVKVPAGSRLQFELHYTPSGTLQKDLSKLGLRFIEKENVTRLMHGGAVLNTKFEIPANANASKFVAQEEIKEKTQLISMLPHMHLRGKSFTFEAKQPGKDWETLLDVPHYDFNWQLKYVLDEPKTLEKGTVLRCTAVFNNSESNRALTETQRSISVYWGEQSWEEMLIGFYETIPIEETKNP